MTWHDDTNHYAGFSEGDPVLVWRLVDPSDLSTAHYFHSIDVGTIQAREPGRFGRIGGFVLADRGRPEPICILIQHQDPSSPGPVLGAYLVRELIPLREETAALLMPDVLRP